MWQRSFRIDKYNKKIESQWKLEDCKIKYKNGYLMV